MQLLTLSLLIPIAYLGILVGSLATFSHLYRQRKITAKLRLEPYFSEHKARNVYLSLLHLPDQDPSNNAKVPDSVLRSALLARAVEDIFRMREIQTRKGALNTLLQRGVVGDEMWQRLLRAEQELDAELKDVVAEANALAPGWSQSIFQSASQMAEKKLLEQRIKKVQDTIPAEKEKWDKQREASRRELENDNSEITPESTHKPNDSPVTTKSSDEDGVMVESPNPDTPGSAGGKKNKKKNKTPANVN